MRNQACCEGRTSTHSYFLHGSAHLDGKMGRGVIHVLALLNLCRGLNTLWRPLSEDGFQYLLPLFVRTGVFKPRYSLMTNYNTPRTQSVLWGTPNMIHV